MFFGNHTTTKAERDAFIASPGTQLWIDPADFHQSYGHKPIVWEEGTDTWYEHSHVEFFELLDLIASRMNFDYKDTAYYKKWAYKGTEIDTRIGNLPRLFESIRLEGVKEPVHCLDSGQRLDGSYRTKIAWYLGHKRVPAIMHKLTKESMTVELASRLLKGRWLSSGKDYYQFPFGNGMWNIPEGGDVYKENAERADVIVPLIKGKTMLDVGCNEGYISLRAAMEGKFVQGFDLDHIHNANLNKAIFEWVQKRDLDAFFSAADASDPDYKPFGKQETVLLLNVIYHLPTPVKLLKRCRGAQVIMQCNLRKNVERQKYFGSHPDDAKALIEMAGMRVVRSIDWRDKPILIATI